jgi:predicted DNA-binding transcriptional regulator AlpA
VTALRSLTSEVARYITRSQLCRRWGVSRSTTYRLQRSGYLRAPVKFGPGVVRWSVAEIEAIEARAAQDRGGRDE